MRGLLAGERVTLEGRFVAARDAVLLPPPARRVPLMVGSNGPRMLGLTLPWVGRLEHVVGRLRQHAGGLRRPQRAITPPAARPVATPGLIRSACVLVRWTAARASAPRTRRRRSRDRPPRSAARLRALGAAGADEVILVADPMHGGVDPRAAREHPA